MIGYEKEAPCADASRRGERRLDIPKPAPFTRMVQRASCGVKPVDRLSADDLVAELRSFGDVALANLFG